MILLLSWIIVLRCANSESIVVGVGVGVKKCENKPPEERVRETKSRIISHGARKFKREPNTRRRNNATGMYSSSIPCTSLLIRRETYLGEVPTGSTSLKKLVSRG